MYKGNYYFILFSLLIIETFVELIRLSCYAFLSLHLLMYIYVYTDTYITGVKVYSFIFHNLNRVYHVNTFIVNYILSFVSFVRFVIIFCLSKICVRNEK